LSAGPARELLNIRSDLTIILITGSSERMNEAEAKKNRHPGVSHEVCFFFRSGSDRETDYGTAGAPGRLVIRALMHADSPGLC
jgi:hypothetical protein